MKSLLSHLFCAEIERNWLLVGLTSNDLEVNQKVHRLRKTTVKCEPKYTYIDHKKNIIVYLS